LALFAHCFTCSKDIFAAARIAEGLTARGIAVLRFDFTGLGSSEGEFANTNFSSNVQDLVRAANHMRETLSAPAILIGHSLGGAAVLAAAPQIPEAVAVVTIGAPSSASHVLHNFKGSLDEIREKGAATVTLAGRPFVIAKQFLDDVADQDFLKSIGRLNKALLVCHAPRDEVVGIDNATAIFTAARHPKSFLSLDTADHLLRKREDAFYVADMIAAWASRFLAPAAQQPQQEALPGDLVEVRETKAGPLAQLVRAGNHRFAAGEPVSVGGDDSGPGPYDLLLAALGACSSMTMRLYADRKKIAAERFTVRLTHRRVHAEDCADCETTSGDIGEITKEVMIEGEVSDADRAKLFEIAAKCPVHRTLTGEIKIRSSLL
jgi:putative redox protein